MTIINRSFEFYEEFCTFIKTNPIERELGHESLFNPTPKNKYYVKTLYEDTYFQDSLPNRPEDATCKYCKDFNLGKTSTYDKDKDVVFGNSIEAAFQKFLESKFNSLANPELHINCERADSEKLNMPDFKIVKKSSGEVLFYFEFKAIFRPYILVKNRVSKEYNCYSHSLTLDYSNGKKLETQKELVEKLGQKNVHYVYWYDLPCVKGIYWMNSLDVYSYIDDSVMYDRKSQEGDFNKNSKKVSSTKKIYLPLNKMHDFHKFYDLINYKLKT